MAQANERRAAGKQESKMRTPGVNAIVIVIQGAPRTSNRSLSLQRRKREAILPRLSIVIGVWFASVSCICPDVPRGVEPVQGLIQEVLVGEMTQAQQHTRSGFNEALRTYDLTTAADDVMKTITSGRGFFAYLRGRKEGLSPEQFKALDFRNQGRVLVDYAQTREEVKPEVRAWLCVWLPGVPWDQAFNDIKLWVAFAAKDYTAAAELARRSHGRTLQPVFLVLGGKKDEAIETLEDLRRDATLTERERSGLRTLEPLILIFAHKFEEARKAIDAQRKSPNLTAKEAQWLQKMEELLGNYEAGIRKRKDSPP